MIYAKCPGIWIQRKNVCECSYCRRVEKARWEMINKIEDVNKLRKQGADKEKIEDAMCRYRYASMMLDFAYMAPLEK